MGTLAEINLTATLSTAALVNNIGCSGSELGSFSYWNTMDAEAPPPLLIGAKSGMKLDIAFNIDIAAGLFNGASALLRCTQAQELELEYLSGAVVILHRRPRKIAVHGRLQMRSAFDVC